MNDKMYRPDKKPSWQNDMQIKVQKDDVIETTQSEEIGWTCARYEESG